MSCEKSSFQRLLLASCACLFLAGAVPSYAAAGPVVAVTGGGVQGKLLQTGAVFKGIPYAQPPVGDLRWREPQPVQSWTGVRQATEYGHACAQGFSGWNKLAATHSSEDCLYLNVWAPEWPAKSKLPVMVWIHGGGNGGGSAMGAGGIEPPFDGASLSRHGVVFVTINYRLGVFGFMGAPELTAESPHHASGEYGILDQIAALKWVHDNIAKFGGDPANVTLFGQSAGGQDTSIIVASPLSQGLVQKAIAESGSPMIDDKRLQSPAQTEQLGVILGQTLNAPATGTIAYMRSLPADKILAAMRSYQGALRKQHLILDVGMDGYAVPAFSPEVYRSGKEMLIPMIFGSNARDFPGARRGGADTDQARIDEVKQRIADKYGNYPDLEARATQAYLGAGGTSSYPPYGTIDMQFGTDHAMRCEAVAMAQWHSKYAPTWQYEFTAGTANHPPLHSAELDFVFGYLRDQASDPALRMLSDQMQDYWTNFAKTGDPNGPGLPAWPKYEAGTQDYMEFSNSGAMAEKDLRGATCPIYVEKLERDLNARKQQGEK